MGRCCTDFSWFNKIRANKMNIKQGAVFMLHCSSTIKKMLTNPLKIQGFVLCNFSWGVLFQVKVQLWSSQFLTSKPLTCSRYFFFFKFFSGTTRNDPGVNHFKILIRRVHQLWNICGNSRFSLIIPCQELCWWAPLPLHNPVLPFSTVWLFYHHQPITDKHKDALNVKRQKH